MALAGEGSDYAFDAIKNCNPLVFVSFAFIIILIVLGYKKIPDKNKNNPILLLITVIVFVILAVLATFIGQGIFYVIFILSIISTIAINFEIQKEFKIKYY